MSRVFHIRPSNDGQTLAAALRKILGEAVPWSEVKRLIAKRHVTLNGNLCLDEARKVRAGDVLHLFEHSRAPLPTDADIVIRHLDEHLVVIEKPAGLNTLRHREEADLPQQRKDKAPTLDELLQRRLNALFHATSRPSRHQPTPSPATSARRSAPPLHPLFVPKSPKSKAPHPPVGKPPSPLRQPSSPPLLRPVHRLDRDTSGLMIFALSPAAEAALERDFARHAIDRRYLAIVHGHLTQPRTIETYLVRDRGDGKRGSSPLGKAAESAGAQRALTHITPLETHGPYSIVECRLETGRTHQIRIHLSELGHPLAGEKVYRDTPPLPDEPPRHALHSHKLALTHPLTGQPLAFESPWPKDLAAWLRRLRQSLSPT